AILAALRQHGIGVCEVTLHVGIGTFKPVTTALVHEHTMESERWEVGAPAAAIAEARRAGGRVVAIGTTVVRTLESAAATVPLEADLPAATGRTELFI